MELRLVRHATLLVETAGLRLLVDPMLGPPGAMPAVEGTPNQRANPLVALPMDPAEVVSGLDALVVTHTHSDHLDPAALSVLPRGVPVLCQPEDADRLRDEGFAEVRPVGGQLEIGGLRVSRTGGRHGTGELGERMGPVSGFVLAAADEPTLYLAGDTIWCPEVERALADHHPAVVVVNAGAAQLLEGDPITMAAPDVAAVARALPEAAVVAVHMEAVNHCLLTRAGLLAALEADGLVGRVAMPADGDEQRFG